MDSSRSTNEAAKTVVFVAGIRPRDELARGCGLALGQRGGVVVGDERCRTSDPSIYAVGECAVAGGRVHGLVFPGYRMARVAVATGGRRSPRRPRRAARSFRTQR